MVLSKAEAEREVARAAREDRIAKAFGQQGKENRAQSLRKRANKIREPAKERLQMLDVKPQIFSGSRLISDDRELVAARLRAQASAAGERVRQLREIKRKKEREVRTSEVERFVQIEKRSSVLAESIAKGSGPLSSSERVRIGGAADPDKSTTQLRARFATGEARRRAVLGLRQRRETTKAIEKAGFEGSRSEFLQQERTQAAQRQRKEAVEQRERFVASGLSVKASQQQVQQARLQLERRGEVVFSQLRSGGNVFDRGGGSAEVGDQVIGVRTVTGKERREREKIERVESTRLPAGFQRDRKGNLILVRDAEKTATAKEIFKEQGAPEKRTIGSIEFGREKRTVLKRKGLFPELSIAKEGEEVSRRSTIEEQIFTIPNKASAQAGGFPIEQDGKPIEFPARFSVTGENREDFPRENAIVQGLKRIDQAAVEQAEKPVFGEGFIKAQQTLTFKGIRKLGGGLQITGEKIEEIGKQTQTFFETRGDTGTVKGRFIEGFKVGTGGEGFRKTAIGAQVVGGTIEEIGRSVKQRPVTAGAGEAFLLGSGFGAVSKTLKLAKASKVAKKATVAGSLVRGTVATARTAEIGTGVLLSGAFAVQTGIEASKAQSPGEVGNVLGRAGLQLGGFVAGAGAGGKGVQAIADTTRSVQNTLYIRRLEKRLKGQLVTRDVARELSTINKDLGLEVAVRPVEARVRFTEAQERGGIKVQETGQREILGESRLVRPEELLRPDDYLLVTSVRRVRQGTLQENIGPQNVVSGKGQPAKTSFVRTERFSGERRAGLLQDAIKPINEKTSIVEVSKSELPRGLRRATQDITIERFDPLQLSGDTRIVPTQRARGKEGKPRGIGFEPKRISSSLVENVQLEALRPFDIKKGDFFTLNPKTGEFSLSRQTEFRKFQRGTKGIPGRRTLTEGRLPESAETFKNLPRELAKDYAKTPAGKAFLAEKGVFRVETIKKAKSKPKKGGSSSPTLSDEVEVESGSQILLKKRVAQTQTRQETRTEQRQETILEQELANPEQRQETRQKRKEKAQSSQFTRNRFAGVADTLAKTASKSALGATLSKSANVFKLRATPTLKSAKKTKQELQQSQLLEQSQRTEQRSLQSQTSLTTQAQATQQSQRTEQRSLQEQVRVQRAREQGRLKQTLTEATELQIPKLGALFDKQRSRGVAGFQVLVKRGGKFELATTKVLTKGQALEVGASIVDASPAQTFKILETGTKAEATGREPSKSRIDSLLNKFTRKKGAFREKQKNLIDTAGEVQQISLKGVRASAQSRKQFKRLGI